MAELDDSWRLEVFKKSISQIEDNLPPKPEKPKDNHEKDYVEKGPDELVTAVIDVQDSIFHNIPDQVLHSIVTNSVDEEDGQLLKESILDKSLLDLKTHGEVEHLHQEILFLNEMVVEGANGFFDKNMASHSILQKKLFEIIKELKQWMRDEVGRNNQKVNAREELLIQIDIAERYTPVVSKELKECLLEYTGTINRLRKAIERMPKNIELEKGHLVAIRRDIYELITPYPSGHDPMGLDIDAHKLEDLIVTIEDLYLA